MELKRTYFDHELATNDYLKELNPKNIVVTRQNVLYNQETGEECYAEITEYMNGSVKVDISTNTVSLFMLFAGLPSTEQIVFTLFDGAGITRAEYLFYASSSLRKIDMSHIIMTDLKTMKEFAQGCSKLEEISFPKTGDKLQDISGLIMGCSSLREVDLYGLNTSNVEDFLKAFHGIGSEETPVRILDLSFFNINLKSDIGIGRILSFRNSYIREVKMPRYISSNCLLMLDGCQSEVVDFSEAEFDNDYIEKNHHIYRENIELTLLPETRLIVREEQAKIVERIVYGGV